MQAIIKPGKLTGSIAAPPSKSMMQRACAGALLHTGKTVILNPGYSGDETVALYIIAQLGARIVSRSEEKIEIESAGVIPIAERINCGESGLAARLFTPIAAISGQELRIEGSGSLRNRPMEVFADILPTLGVEIRSFSGSLPFFVRGPLRAKSLNIDGSLSSQFLSGILFALTDVAREPVTITVQQLKSRPYIDLTLSMLEVFGRHVAHRNYEEFFIDPGAFTHKEIITTSIEADWSSAAYWLAGAAINGTVEVQNTNPSSLQADRKIMDVLRQAGYEQGTERPDISISAIPLKAFSFDATDCPDLFPILAILAAYAEGESRIKGLSRLVHKESNRAESICAMLRGFGVSHETSGNSLTIRGGKELLPATIDSFGDHRIAMAAAIGALKASGPVTIIDAAAVSKSYPAYFDHLASLGIKCYIKS